MRDREGYLILAGVWWWYDRAVYGVSERELARGGYRSPVARSRPQGARRSEMAAPTH